MPTYDYECAACGRRFEVVHGVDADGPAACPLCGEGPVRKVITAANVHYKGSGWAKKERRTAVTSGAKGADASSSDGGASSETPASSDSDGSGPSTKKPGAASTDGTGTKTAEKPSKSGASKTTD